MHNVPDMAPIWVLKAAQPPSLLMIVAWPTAGVCSVHSDSWQRLKMGMGQPGPGLGPGPMASRPILGVMGRPISSRCYGLDGPLCIMGRPKYFSIILNYEYYEHF